MTFKSLIFWLFVIVSICTYAAGIFIDQVQESNRITMHQIERNNDASSNR